MNKLEKRSDGFDIVDSSMVKPSGPSRTRTNYRQTLHNLRTSPAGRQTRPSKTHQGKQRTPSSCHTRAAPSPVNRVFLLDHIRSRDCQRGCCNAYKQQMKTQWKTWNHLKPETAPIRCPTRRARLLPLVFQFAKHFLRHRPSTRRCIS